jgi:hypothetical protein
MENSFCRSIAAFASVGIGPHLLVGDWAENVFRDCGALKSNQKRSLALDHQRRDISKHQIRHQSRGNQDLQCLELFHEMLLQRYLIVESTVGEFPATQ